jgi:SAM-dependent methyltransferase
MKNFWNERYDQDAYCYGTKPNLFFSQSLEKFSPGKILLPAEGEGRNAVFAAQKNWEVQAFDWSEAGQVKALKLAKSNSVSIDYKILSFEEMAYKPDSFDVIGLIYVHLHPQKREQIHKKLISYLKKGGVLILEGFEKKHIEYNSKNEKAGGPKDLNFLFSKEEILKDFEGMEVLFIEEKELVLAEGAYHCGESSVIRLIAKKLN